MTDRNGSPMMTTSDREIPYETLTQMVQTIKPEWIVRKTELAQFGYLSVYRLTIETGAGIREYFLKATPDGGRHGIDAEARLLCILSDLTSIPVPEVIGVVDTHDNLQAPFFLMEAVGGQTISREDMDRLSEESVRKIARQTGRYLAELHKIDAVNKFGRVERASAPLVGKRPSSNPNQITVTGFQKAAPSDNWPIVLRSWAEDILNSHAATRFSDLTPSLRSVVNEQIESLSGPFRPAISRIDASYDNYLLDPATGEVRAMIDWAFTLVTPPAYDLVCVERNLAGGPWGMLLSASNRQQLVRESMVDEYRKAAPYTVIKQFRNHHMLYEVLSLCRSMIHLDEGRLSYMTREQRDSAAKEYRNAISEFV